MHGYSLLRPSLNSDYFHDLYDQAVAQGIDVEGHRASSLPEQLVMCLLSDTETGPGVFETALAYTEAKRMADNASLFKLVAKSVGMKYGIMPTFMAKPWGDVSHSGGIDGDGTADYRFRCLDAQGLSNTYLTCLS